MFFYPYFSITGGPSACMWRLGGAIPGTTNNFGGNTGYGLFSMRYLLNGGHGVTVRRYNVFRNLLRTESLPGAVGAG